MARKRPYRLLTVDSPSEAWTRDARFQAERCSLAQAEQALEGGSFAAVVLRARAAGAEVEETVRRWKRLRPHVQITVELKAPPSTRELVALMHAGCFDVLDSDSGQAVREAAERLRERIEFVRARGMERLVLKQSARFAGLVGESPEMAGVRELIARAAGLGCAVLLKGETGTGKGLAARAIHALSPRQTKPFVTVDCACLAPALVESELYGAARGAYTGASSDRAGLVEAADGGTLFFDEIGELPIEVQPRLLRLLEEGEARRLGSSRTLKIDARIISATSRDLEAELDERRFRLDLYYRINVLSIELPALRDRRRDIPLLARHFASRHLFRGEPIELTDSALDALGRYRWPGNVRELKNVIAAAVATLTRNSIHAANLPPRVLEAAAAAPRGVEEALDWKAEQRRMIRKALARAQGDKTRAARLLGIGKTTLYRKLKEMREEPRRPADRRDPRPLVM